MKQKIWWGGELTFAVHLAAVLNDTRLAVLMRPGSRRLVVERVVAREVLLRVHGRRIAIADRHVLHEHGEGVVGSRGRARHGVVPVGRRIERIRHSRSGRIHGWGGGRGHLLRLSQTGAEGRRTGLQGRADGRIGGSLTAITRRAIRRKLTIVAAGHDAHRDTTDARIVVVEMLLCVIVQVTSQAGGAAVLNSRHIVGRVRLMQLGRRCQDVGGGRRDDRSGRRIQRSSRSSLLKELDALDRVTDIGRAAAAEGAGVGRRADRGTAVELGVAHGRHALLVAMLVNIVPAVGMVVLGPRSLGEGEVGSSGGCRGLEREKRQKLTGQSHTKRYCSSMD